jgi:thiamine-monophosphate kinase
MTQGSATGFTPLGAGEEFDRIRAIWRRLGSTVAGAGDDCAVVEIGGERLALSIDLSVEGTHFRLGWMTPEEVGWRAASAGL